MQAIAKWVGVNMERLTGCGLACSWGISKAESKSSCET